MPQRRDGPIPADDRGVKPRPDRGLALRRSDRFVDIKAGAQELQGLIEPMADVAFASPSGPPFHDHPEHGDHHRGDQLGPLVGFLIGSQAVGDRLRRTTPPTTARGKEPAFAETAWRRPGGRAPCGVPSPPRTRSRSPSALSATRRPRTVRGGDWQPGRQRVRGPPPHCRRSPPPWTGSTGRRFAPRRRSDRRSRQRTPGRTLVLRTERTPPPSIGRGSAASSAPAIRWWSRSRSHRHGNTG